LTAFLRREGICQDRLRDRHHAAAAEPLQDAEQQQRVQIRGEPAQYRAQGEQSETYQEEGFAAKYASKKAARGQDDELIAMPFVAVAEGSPDGAAVAGGDEKRHGKSPKLT
jgi:DnaJ-domain-containing protein 1